MIAEICIDDAGAFCVVALFEDYGLFLTQRHTFFEATKCCNGYFSDDGVRPVCQVNRPSAPLVVEKCGRQALQEHKLNSQAHFKGRRIERQTPDEPLEQFHIKSTDIQISTMICQVPAEFTGAGIAEFHTPAWPPLPSSQPSLDDAWQQRVMGNICESQCVYVCLYGWIHSPDKELCFYV